MEKKITLLAVNAKYVHSSLSVWYLAQAVSQFSQLEHKVKVVESNINQPDGDILTKVTSTEPDVLGISVYIWNARKVEALLRNIGLHLPNTKLVLGGPEASYNAEYWLLQGADFVIQGEGERSFPLLLDALSASDSSALNAVPGLWRYENGSSIFTQAEEPISTIINPYSRSYWDALDGRIAYLETSRGCPFKCAFCLSGGSRLRFFPLDAAKEQLLRLSQSGAKTIKLVDRTFNCNAERAYALFEYVIGLDTTCCFHFEVAADLFDGKALALLRTATSGRIQLEAGLQSFYQPTLDAVARKTSLEDAESNLKALLDGGNIHIHVDLIAGLPWETLEIFQQSFNRAYSIGAHKLQLGFLKLLHGSRLREQAEDLGLRYRKTPPYEITSSPWLTADDLVTIKQVEHALERIYNSNRFIETVQYALQATGISPFELYHRLGKAASGYKVPLGIYAEQVYDCLCGLPGIDAEDLRDYMICDWLCAMRGNNIPAFLRVQNRQAEQVRVYAEGFLGRKIALYEFAALQSGGVFIDSSVIDPVTGRYRLHRQVEKS